MLKSAPLHPLELISARIDREITPGEARFLEAHLQMCPACQRKWAELRAIATGLAELRVAAPPAEAIDRLLVRLREPVERVAPARASATPSGQEPEPEAVAAATPPRSRLGLWLALGVGVPSLAAVVLFLALGARREERVVAPEPVAIPTAVPPPAEVTAPLPVAIAETAEHVPASAARETPRAPAPPPRSVRQARASRAPSKPPVPIATPARPSLAEPAQADPAPLPEVPPVVTTGSRDQGLELNRSVLRPIYFKGGSKRLTAEARERVEAVARYLSLHQGVQLEIQGYTDERRSTGKSRELGQKRALAVARHLESLGVDPSRLRPVSHGEHRPADPADRVEFVLKR